jgi:organic hydroperoxide reductase OsmC/OhrA
MADHDHAYRLALRWDSADDGTIDYRSYSRRWIARVEGKPDLIGSADASFRGDPSIYNPEDLLVASLSSCHLLSYLALCARKQVRVIAYTDDARGRMVTSGGGGRFAEVVLRPHVTIAAGDLELARALHHDAHQACFIAASVNFPVTVEPTVVAAPVRRDLAVRLPDRPGVLATFGEALGAAGISLEGGGGFAGVVHFLVEDADRAAAAARDAGLEVLAIRDVLVTRLRQDQPGQLGAIARALADAGVNIDCVYSDHDGQLVLCVDRTDDGRRVTDAFRVAAASSGENAARTPRSAG